jgi:sugar (pentulose or hexulose) kinase
MSDKRTVLAIDSGTQSVRVILFDDEGNELAVGRHKHEPLLRPMPGAVEQDPHDIWTSMVAACRECMDRAAELDLPAPSAAGITSQRKLLIPCDRNGEPLSPAHHWLDRRTAPPARPGVFSKAVRLLSGADGTLNNLLQIAQANILRETYPQAYHSATWMLTVTGWLTLKLTDQVRDAHGAITGVYPFDVKSCSWRSSPSMYDLTGFQRHKLPELVAAGSELGRITPQAAELTGMPVGMPLVAVGGDKQAEVLGAGVTPESGAIAEISLGTGSSLSLVRRRVKSSLTFRWLTNAAAEPRAWVHEYMVFRGFWTWTWFIEQFASQLRERADAEGCTPEELLSAQAAAVPAGCEGLMVLPRWFPTLEDLTERGAILGFAEHHTAAHLARALVEGIAMDLRRGTEVMQAAFAPRLDRLRVGGGGARSRWVVQTVADVFDLPVEIPHTPELSALGAAINAAVAAGIHRDHGTAARAMVRVGEVVEPDPGNVVLLGRQYNDAFLPAIEALKPLHRALDWRR